MLISMTTTETPVPPTRPPVPEEGYTSSKKPLIQEDQQEIISKELQRLLPAALLEATSEAREAAAAVSSPEAALTPAVATLAAALGSAAAPLVASALNARLRRTTLGYTHWPR